MTILQKFKGKSFLDLFWSFSDNLLQQIINFVVGIILARLLLPEEFGLIGIITVFLTISLVFVDGGFSAALINKKQTTEVDYNTVFYSNIAISALIYLVIFLSAGWVGSFFDDPRIADLLRLAGLNILLISFSSIHRTIIVRNLNFRLITVVSTIAVVISACCAVYMAYHGYGVYSLIYRILIGEVITIMLFWTVNKWRPAALFSVQSFKEMFRYGGNLFVSNLLNTLNTNIYYLIIGKFFSPVQLGYYTRAITFRDLASTNISNTIKRVSFSTLSKITEKKELSRKFEFFRTVTYLLISFSMLILFFCSREIILILLKEKWLPSVSILKIMSLAGVFMAVYNQNLDFLAVIGKTKRYLHIEVLGKILILPVIFAGIYYGFTVFLAGIVLQSIVMFIIVSLQLEFIEIGTFRKQMLLVLEFGAAIFALYMVDGYFSAAFSNIYVLAIIRILAVLILWLLFNFRRLKLLIKPL